MNKFHRGQITIYGGGVAANDWTARLVGFGLVAAVLGCTEGPREPEQQHATPLRVAGSKPIVHAIQVVHPLASESEHRPRLLVRVDERTWQDQLELPPDDRFSNPATAPDLIWVPLTVAVKPRAGWELSEHVGIPGDPSSIPLLIAPGACRPLKPNHNRSEQWGFLATACMKVDPIRQSNFYGETISYLDFRFSPDGSSPDWMSESIRLEWSPEGALVLHIDDAAPLPVEVRRRTRVYKSEILAWTSSSVQHGPNLLTEPSFSLDPDSRPFHDRASEWGDLPRFDRGRMPLHGDWRDYQIGQDHYDQLVEVVFAGLEGTELELTSWTGMTPEIRGSTVLVLPVPPPSQAGRRWHFVLIRPSDGQPDPLAVTGFEQLRAAGLDACLDEPGLADPGNYEATLRFDTSFGRFGDPLDLHRGSLFDCLVRTCANVKLEATVSISLRVEPDLSSPPIDPSVEFPDGQQRLDDPPRSQR